MARWVLPLITLFSLQACMTQDSTIPADYRDGSTSDSQSLDKAEAKKKKKKNTSEESVDEESQEEELRFPAPNPDYSFAQNMMIISTASELTDESSLALLWQLERKKNDLLKIKERPFIIVTTDNGPKLILNLARGKDLNFRDWVINLESSAIISTGSVGLKLNKEGKIKGIEISERRPDCSLKVDLDAAFVYFQELLTPTHPKTEIEKSDNDNDECLQILENE